MRLSNWQFAALVGTGVVLSLGMIAAWNNGWFEAKVEKPQVAATDAKPEEKTNETKSDEPPFPGAVKVGGVWRPKTDIESQFKPITPGTDAEWAKKPTQIGTSPALDPELNPHTKSVAEAIRTGKHPERLSVMIAPQAFDKESFLKDPEPYLNTVEPGRVFQTAQPGPGIEHIKRSTNYMYTLLQGESVALTAEADPGMPVTFYSSKLGQFSNKLTSITVRADDKGIATTTFTASPGTYGDIDIIAGSPTREGNASYLVRVELPQTPVVSAN